MATIERTYPTGDPRIETVLNAFGAMVYFYKFAKPVWGDPTHYCNTWSKR